MPIHDWTKVGAGTWHAFHLAWIAEIQSSLNSGRLPSDYYAMAEQIIGPYGPDVLTLQEVVHENWSSGAEEGGLAVKTMPPKTRLVTQAEHDDYTPKRRTLSIRHSSNDRIVALIELVSPGNKSTQYAVESFVEKAVEALYRGYHLVIIDLFPRTTRDINGLHGEIWKLLGEDCFRLNPDEPLVLASYSAGHQKVAYIEPTAVGKELIDMPLFLTADRYVPVPLEETYNRAYSGLPKKWQFVLEGKAKQ